MVPAGGVVDTAAAPGPGKPLPHSPSYYAATRNDDSSYGPLAGDQQADVCVIGGGFTGIATALTLAERGYRVCLLEQHRIGWGASGRNGGQLIGGMPGEKNLLDHWGPRIADTLFAIGYRGHDIIAERVDRYAIDCDLKYGYMDVAVRPRQLLDQQVWYEDLCSRGMEQQVRLVPREELYGLLGTDRYLGGLINNRNGHLHPLNLCLGEARAAAGLGVSIHEGTAVTDIIPGSKPVVVSPDGRVTADFVVLAGRATRQCWRGRIMEIIVAFLLLRFFV